jgi:Gpi18-like mannosyltransferase
MSRQSHLTIVVVALFILTIAVEAGAYVKWEYLGDGTNSLAFEQFHRFPWFRFSALLTAFTAVGAVAAIRVSDAKRGNLAFTHALLVVPLIILVLYPGPQALGLHSDPSFAGAGFLVILHGIGFNLIARLFELPDQTRHTD